MRSAISFRGFCKKTSGEGKPPAFGVSWESGAFAPEMGLLAHSPLQERYVLLSVALPQKSELASVKSLGSC